MHKFLCVHKLSVLVYNPVSGITGSNNLSSLICFWHYFSLCFQDVLCLVWNTGFLRVLSWAIFPWMTSIFWKHSLLSQAPIPFKVLVAPHLYLRVLSWAPDPGVQCPLCTSPWMSYRYFKLPKLSLSQACFLGPHLMNRTNQPSMQKQTSPLL